MLILSLTVIILIITLLCACFYHKKKLRVLTEAQIMSEGPNGFSTAAPVIVGIPADSPHPDNSAPSIEVQSPQPVLPNKLRNMQ